MTLEARYSSALGFSLVLFLAGEAAACDVPVFRYALEFWRPEPYLVTVFHRAPLADADQTVIDDARRSTANVLIETINVSGPLPESKLALWKAQSPSSMPWTVVHYPDAAKIDAVAWSGPFTGEGVHSLLESPARREIARRIVNGDSAVWLLLGSGVAMRDSATTDLVQAELTRLEMDVTIPVPEEDSPSSSTPTHPKFSLLRMSRGDAVEKIFIAMITNSDATAAHSDIPIVIPVIGKGRAPTFLSGEAITAPAIAGMAEFIIGSCSCELQRGNPGLDLLIASDWGTLTANRAQERQALTPLAPSNHIPTPIAQSAESREPWIRIRPFLWAGSIVASALVLITGIRACRRR
jgi:hypothetical protein